MGLSTAAAGGHVAWVVPHYKNGRPLWRWCEQACTELRRSRLVRLDKTERLVEFPNGGFLGIYSADNPDSLRGEAFNLVVVDEAARIPADTYADIILPTLADVDGEAILISTPKGRNWFYDAFKTADGIRTAAFTAPSSDNPNPLIQRAAEEARLNNTERTYRQEWLAEFVEDGGGVFRKVRQAAIAERQSEQRVLALHRKTKEPVAWHGYVIGVDWGKVDDYTVFAVFDATLRSLVHFDRFNGVDYQVAADRLGALCERFKPSSVIAESNAMGTPIIEQLVRRGLPVQPFATTNASKAQAIDALALAFERADVTILDDAVLVDELEAYESRRLPSGLTRYQAPEGRHDDCVMALALGWQGVAYPLAAERGPSIWD